MFWPDLLTVSFNPVWWLMVKSYQGYETHKCLPLGLCGHAVMPEIDMSCRRLALLKLVIHFQYQSNILSLNHFNHFTWCRVFVRVLFAHIPFIVFAGCLVRCPTLRNLQTLSGVCVEAIWTRLPSARCGNSSTARYLYLRLWLILTSCPV